VFNPRKIVLSYLEDDYEPLVHNNDSPIWLCAVCFSCDEFCPQDVKPHEAITYLRNLAVAKGKSPDRIRAVVEAVNKSGVSTQVARSLKARREALGLADFTEPGALPSCLFEG
jgi:heterodisulfide reductase subunit C